MRKEDIKWAAIQPLTGGMYLGAEEAIGHPAEFILSFKGLNKNFGNEEYLEKYLEKHNRNVDRYDIQEGMFDSKLLETLKPTIYYNDEEVENMSEVYENLDLVVAVPVCSGLSMATSASQETKDIRNCNMKFITKYTLSVIKPKVYVFENAPTLMGSRGVYLVEEFKDLASEYGYSVLFYKTDTNLHYNCQKRPRTFVIFFKHTDDLMKSELPFKFDYERQPITVNDYFLQMEKTDLNNESLPTSEHNWAVIDYVKSKYGDDWRDHIEGNLMSNIIKENKINDLREYIQNNVKDNEKILKYIDHIIYKISLGKNYYQDDVCLSKKHFPAVQFRSMYNMLHPFEDRICTIREYLNLMGHPSDFEWISGNNRAHLAKIGQNVPVKTAKFIVNNCIKALESWGIPRETDNNFMFQDNIKEQKMATIM